MSSEAGFQPTPYLDVNAVLHQVYSGARAILGDSFVGMYLYGSLATHTFDPHSSDIDFLIVTNVEIRGAKLGELIAMHARIGTGKTKWATQLEGAYIPRDALRRYDPTRATHPHLDRDGAILAIVDFHTDWVIQRYVLREYGITIDGPPIQTLIDPISPDDLRKALRQLLDFWWEPMAYHPEPLEHAGYRSYTVMTMCRVLYTVETGGVVPKGVACDWAQQNLDSRWSPLIDLANRERNGTPLITVEATCDFIRYTVQRVKQGA